MHTAAPRSPQIRSRWWLLVAGLATVMLLAACGFALRGVTPLPFSTLYLGLGENTRFGSEVSRSIRAASPQTRIVSKPSEAEATLQVIKNERTLREVSLNAQGRVEEYELGINLTFRVITAKGIAILPDTTLSIYRDMPYDDQVIQAKEIQTENLYQSMQQSLVDRLLRRLTAPDVRTAYEAAMRDSNDYDGPVYDPNIEINDDRPSSWQTPALSGPGSW